MKRLCMTGCAVILALSGCGEPLLPPEPEADVCARTGACEVRGVDLIVDEVSLAFPATHPIDQPTGLPWVEQHDSVPVRYLVRNRGDVSSPATRGSVGSCSGCLGGHVTAIQIPALEPGAVDTGTAMVQATQGFFVASAVVVSLEPGIDAVDEPFYRNNRRASAQSYLTVAPDMRGTLEVLGSELRVGEPLRMVLVLRNHARHAVLRGDSIAFCFRRNDGSGLHSCDRAFGMQKLPDLGPNQQWRDTIEVPFTHSNYVYEKHSAISGRLDACIGGRVTYSTQPCAAGRDILLRPSLETVCDVARLTPGVALVDTFPSNFTGFCYVYNGRFDAYAFDAEAGASYQVQVTTASTAPVPDVSLWSAAGEQVGPWGLRATQAAIAAAGRYYVVLRGASVTPPEYEVLLTQTPDGGARP